MKIPSEDLKQALIKIKEDMVSSLDKSKTNKVKDIFIANISVVEAILLWIHKTEKEGVINMESLKIGLGRTVKLSEIKKESKSPLDLAIIEEAQHLKEPGDAREIDPKSLESVTYFTNRVYHLAKTNRIHPDAKPIRSGEKLYIALKPTAKRKERTTK